MSTASIVGIDSEDPETSDLLFASARYISSGPTAGKDENGCTGSVCRVLNMPAFYSEARDEHSPKEI